ncbi:Glycosyl hydrolase family 76 [Pedobacter suwonensis]|uniref:Glycosyl hydrolase family 76 n=1 Tax=Pedobacter suwonensis TaxID=332999 RepID=A0A1I0SNQ4_9SPHI|nr:glycoside hydrolase family 76 protein [Pedobacter suwonensis]SFA41161.1 Glycosyl hydrolase family 76 [Pedobacter suwonensis]
MKALFRYTAFTLALFFAVSCKKQPAAAPVVPPPVLPPVVPGAPVNYLQQAKDTHTFTVNNLLTASYGYRANTTSKSSNCFEWYNVSQIYADAAMVAAGETGYLVYMNNTFKFMDNMWDKKDLRGGYFASVNLDGSGAGGDKYVDDNALSGMVYLEAYEVTTGADKQAYLAKAKACADWLINSGLWDNAYGGGFYWNTQKPEKPTQTNGLTLQLFAKLYGLTGASIYRDWARQVDAWLSAKMFDPNTGLYIWKIDGAGEGSKHNEKFTYDNAIMIEAFLIYSKVFNDPSYLTKAQNLGKAMNNTLWNALYKGYVFNTAETRINPAWCAWGSQAMIRLYEADKNEAWLVYAKENINRLNIANRNSTTLGYYFFAGFDGQNRSTEMETVDQAWMQRLQAMLSKF